MVPIVSCWLLFYCLNVNICLDNENVQTYVTKQTSKNERLTFCTSVKSLRPTDAYMWVSKLTIIVSNNSLSPGRRQAIIWTNAGILLIRTLGTNSNDILSEIYTFSVKKMPLRMSSAKWRQFCLGLNVLKCQSVMTQLNNVHMDPWMLFLNNICESFHPVGVTFRLWKKL